MGHGALRLERRGARIIQLMNWERQGKRDLMDVEQADNSIYTCNIYL